MSIKQIRFMIICGSIILLSAYICGCQSEQAAAQATAVPPSVTPEELKEVEQNMTETIESPEPIPDQEEFTLKSSAFLVGEPIPSTYTCNGDDISPPIAWRGAPNDTNTFALIMDDPDAPLGWVHWVLFNIPRDAIALDEGIPAEAEAPDGSRQGTNSWGAVGYGGPCPPSGVHRYFFKLYALDTSLALDESATKEDVLGAMEGHILMETELMGTYSASEG